MAILSVFLAATSAALGWLAWRWRRDALKLRRDNGRLLSQNIESGAWACGVAHDINNQLMPVLGYVDLAQKKLTAEHPVYPLLSDAKSAGQRCSATVEKLLVATRPAAKEMEKRSASAAGGSE